MKKQYFSFLVLQCFSFILNSQQHDFNWVMGYGANSGSRSEGTTIINFDSKTGYPDIFKDNRLVVEHYFYGCTMSDFKGKFKFTFDTYDIVDYSLKSVLNAKKQICPDLNCRHVPQGNMILPSLKNKNEYLIFTVKDTILPLNDSMVTVIINKLELNIVFDDTVNKRIVLRPNPTLLLRDSMDYGKLVACKHANGRDWWIVVPGMFDKMFIFLYDLSGIKLFNTQQLDNKRTLGGGHAQFSPNGNYVCFSSLKDDNIENGYEYDFYHFDRCNGLLFNHQRIEIQNEGKENGWAGCAFSNDSKLLYLSTTYSLHQYEIDNSGKLGTKLYEASYDGYQTHLFGNTFRPTLFGSLVNCPDGRIYMNSDHLQSKNLHVIENPNGRGVACNFRQHAVELPAIIIAIPSFPHYRLGPEDGTVCDSLGIDYKPVCWWRYLHDSLDKFAINFADASTYNVNNWSWNFGDNTSSSEINPRHIFTKTGEYRVCLTVSNTKGVDSLCRTVVIGTNSNDEETLNAHLKVFPNPSTGMINVFIPEPYSDDITISFFNTIGQEQMQKSLRQGNNTFSLETIQEGLYYYNITKNSRIITSGCSIYKK